MMASAAATSMSLMTQASTIPGCRPPFRSSTISGQHSRDFSSACSSSGHTSWQSSPSPSHSVCCTAAHECGTSCQILWGINGSRSESWSRQSRKRQLQLRVEGSISGLKVSGAAVVPAVAIMSCSSSSSSRGSSSKGSCTTSACSSSSSHSSSVMTMRRNARSATRFAIHQGRTASWAVCDLAGAFTPVGSSRCRAVLYSKVTKASCRSSSRCSCLFASSSPSSSPTSFLSSSSSSSSWSSSSSLSSSSPSSLSSSTSSSSSLHASSSLLSLPSELPPEPFSKQASLIAADGSNPIDISRIICHLAASDRLQDILLSNEQPRLQVADDMIKCADRQLNTFDLSDKDGSGVLELVFGLMLDRVRREKGEEQAAEVRGMPCWSPYPQRMSGALVAERVAQIRKRMQVAAVDVLQFHWRHHEQPGALDALLHLTDLREAGKIRQLSVVDFEPQQLLQLLGGEVPLAAVQVKASPISMGRPKAFAEICSLTGLKIIARETSMGGLISEKLLGVRDAMPLILEEIEDGNEEMEEAIEAIQQWGGIRRIQIEALEEIAIVSKRHRVSMAAVAARLLLLQPHVAGVVMKARGGISHLIQESDSVLNVEFDEGDHDRLSRITKVQ